MRSSDRAPTDPWLQFRGARLRYRDEGKGFPLVLLHGWALDLDMWQPQVDAWSTRFRIVRMDRRGFGRSSGQPSIADDAADTVALVDHLELARFALLGMSQGGRVALRVVTGARRDRLACLILDGAPLDDDESIEEVPLERYRALAQREGLEAFRNEWRAHPFTRLHTTDAAARDLLDRMTLRYPARDLLAGGAGHKSMDAPTTSSIEVPTLVINGERDTGRRRAMGTALCRALPRAEHVVIRGAGHLPNLDNPHDYAAAVARFLAQHVPAE